MRQQIKAEYHQTLASILGAQGRWKASLKVAGRFLANRKFTERQIGEVTEYFISAAANDYGKAASDVLEPHLNIPSLEPIFAGLKLFLGEEVLTAQEIKEIGKDVAERIRERRKLS